MIVEITSTIDIDTDLAPIRLAQLINATIDHWGDHSVSKWSVSSTYKGSIVRVFSAQGDYLAES